MEAGIVEKWFVGDEERDDGEKPIEAVKLINLTTSNHNFLFPLMFLLPSMHSASYFGICPNTAVPVVVSIAVCTADEECYAWGATMFLSIPALSGL